ncbi:hypothetical protein DRP07_07995 [Archaeoglobales archaeon]|nr:MAG: hypothetical protein DRP07_07995 [Archaeoglobales archaeon]
MEIAVSGNKIIMKDKVFTELDRFVFEFLELIPEIKYVIVSGYLSILFGRSRGTEDIDILVERFDENTFGMLYNRLRSEKYYFLNPGGVRELYQTLKEGLAVRTSKEGMIIPNIELKFVRDDIERYSLENRVRLILENDTSFELYISPIELQIPYKLYLGGDKDIEDAVYLWEIFKKYLEREKLKKFMGKLRVDGRVYGIEIE